MPTGYTAVLLSNPETTFEQWALLCARAFGALVTMRDDSMDAEIPEELKPSTYAGEQAEASKIKYQKLLQMDPAAQQEHGAARRREAIAAIQRSISSNTAENNTLNAMLARVMQWEPPTKEHKGMKDFMMEQLRISKHNNEWSESELQRLETKLPIEFYVDDLQSELRSISFYEKSQHEENARTASRNKWLRDLRDSLALQIA